MLRNAYVMLFATLAASLGAGACSSDSPSGGLPISQAGSGGASAGTGVAGGSGGTFSSGGTGGSSVGGTSVAGTGPAGSLSGGTSAGGAGGTASGGGSGGGGTGGGSAGGAPSGTAPTCKAATPSPNAARAIECDSLLQSLDFEDKYSYVSPPASIKVTNFGKAIGQTAINDCSPYCYSKNLTVGIDIVGGMDDTLKGEVIAEYPATGAGLPITAADANRNILAWITFDGAAQPDFEIDTQLVLETTTGVVPSVESKAFFKTGANLNPFGPFSIANDFSYKNGSEFKYFGATGANGFPTAPANVIGIGFRITAKATA